MRDVRRLRIEMIGMVAVLAALAGTVCAAGTDYSADPAFVRKFGAAAANIARRQMAADDVVRAKAGASPCRRISTGAGFPGAFLWDTAFAAVWAARLPAGSFPAAESLDYLYGHASKEGFISREFSADGTPVWSDAHPVAFAPPLLSWAERELYEHGHTDRERIRRVLPSLVRHHDFCASRFRRDDGLYFGDMLGCGMDDLPRGPVGRSYADCAKGGIAFTKDMIAPASQAMWDAGWFRKNLDTHAWNRQAGWIDMSSQMALDARTIAFLARETGDAKTAERFEDEWHRIADAVNRLCWDERTGFYYDRGPDGLILRRHAGAFWTLLAGIATGERAKRLAEAAMDEKAFARPCGLPSLPADDPDYDPENGYWTGPVWPPTTYVAIRGLLAQGFRTEADRLARRWYNACAALWVKTGTCWENISPDQCEAQKARAKRDFCGWAALAPIALPQDLGWQTNVSLPASGACGSTATGPGAGARSRSVRDSRSRSR